MQNITLMSIPQFPHVQAGDNLAELLAEALTRAEIQLQDGDVIAIAQKIVSKAEGEMVHLRDVSPSPEAIELAEEVNKDPRLVQLILQESDEISRKKKTVLIVRHKLGFTSANAGIDMSNVSEGADGEIALLLPKDPDGTAQRLRKAIKIQFGVDVGIVITDSHGRPFRLGTVGVAIGVAGVPALWDRRGEHDLYGYELKHTEVGVADEIAAAAGLLMGQADEGNPVILIRGLTYPTNNGTASDLIRPKEMDLYRQ